HQVLHGGGGVVAGRVGLELEGAPHDLHVGGVLVAAQGVLEAHLADVAPGARDVGPDLDLHPRTVTVGAAAAGGRGYPGPGVRARCEVPLAKTGCAPEDRARAHRPAPGVLLASRGPRGRVT